MQREPFPRVEADDQAPVLPLHLIAIDVETRPVRLGDLERLDSLAKLLHPVGGIVARRLWQRPVALRPLVLFDPNDFHLVEIDDRAQALDRPGVAIVSRIAADETERTGQPAGAFLFDAVIPGRPDIHHDQAGITDAIAPLQSGLEFLAAQYGLLAFDLLIDRHGWLDARNGAERSDSLVIERDGCL